MHDDDRRQFPRFRTRRKVSVILSSGEVLDLWTHDVSKTGLQLLSPYNADRGDILQMFISIPIAQGKEHARVDLRARVAHVTYSGSDGAYKVGFEIHEFVGEEAGYIWESWIDRKLDQQYAMQGMV